MDQDRCLELIALLAQDKSWAAIVLIGKELLDNYYPTDIFTGESGDKGPTYVVALRNALMAMERESYDHAPRQAHPVADETAQDRVATIQQDAWDSEE